MSRDRNITIADIAREAGVSIATASRVINRSNHPINAATCERVLQTVEELGFTPSAIARAWRPNAPASSALLSVTATTLTLAPSSAVSRM